MGNLGIKSQINREPINRDEMKKRKEAFLDFETQLAIDFIFGSEGARNHRAHRINNDGSDTEFGGEEEIKQPQNDRFDRQSTNLTQKTGVFQKRSPTKFDRRHGSDGESSTQGSNSLMLRKLGTLDPRLQRNVLDRLFN